MNVLNQMKKVFSFTLMALIVVISFNNLSAHAQSISENIENVGVSESVSVITNLEDHLHTKADKLTFDLWAADAQGNKISASHVTVTSNGKNVPINWDDSERTSYTLNLDVGVNQVLISVNYTEEEYILEYNIHREYAEDGDVIGTYIFSLDAFAIGLGYIIEPIEVNIIKGRNAAHELDAVLKANGFAYENTGTLDNNFYLSYLLDDTNIIYKTTPQIPEVLKEALDGFYDEGDYWEGELGEFNFNSLSGWMYAVNNVFPNVGFADYYLSESDVMRVQYTIGLGSDIGGGYAWGMDFYETANKDELTRQIAKINSSEFKEDYLSVPENESAYNDALDVLQIVDASQQNVDTALAQIQPIDLLEIELKKFK